MGTFYHIISKIITVTVVDLINTPSAKTPKKQHICPGILLPSTKISQQQSGALSSSLDLHIILQPNARVVQPSFALLMPEPIPWC